MCNVMEKEKKWLYDNLPLGIYFKINKRTNNSATKKIEQRATMMMYEGYIRG